MGRSSKCPKCSAAVDRATDVLAREKWPSEVWPIYQCSNCGAQLEEDNRSLVYRGFEIVLMLMATNGLLSALVFWVSGNEMAATIVGWVAFGGLMYWYVTKPVRLAEWGQYAKRE